MPSVLRRPATAAPALGRGPAAAVRRRRSGARTWRRHRRHPRRRRRRRGGDGARGRAAAASGDRGLAGLLGLVAPGSAGSAAFAATYAPGRRRTSRRPGGRCRRRMYCSCAASSSFWFSVSVCCSAAACGLGLRRPRGRPRPAPRRPPPSACAVLRTASRAAASALDRATVARCRPPIASTWSVPGTARARCWSSSCARVLRRQQRPGGAAELAADVGRLHVLDELARGPRRRCGPRDLHVGLGLRGLLPRPCAAARWRSATFCSASSFFACELLQRGLRLGDLAAELADLAASAAFAAAAALTWPCVTFGAWTPSGPGSASARPGAASGQAAEQGRRQRDGGGRGSGAPPSGTAQVHNKLRCVTRSPADE